MKNTILLFLLLALVSFNQCTSKNNAVTPTDSGSKEKAGSLSRFAIHALNRSYLYTVDSKNLSVFQLSPSGEPVFKKTIEVGPEIETIFPFKDKLFIGSTTMLYIYSLADPADPKAEGKAASKVVSYRCDPIVVKDNVAYATLRANSRNCGTPSTQSALSVCDVTDVKNPKEKTSLPLQEPYGLGYSDITLYVCQRKGLTLFNIASPLAPKAIKTIDEDTWFKDVIADDDMLICWTDGGLTLYDISDQVNPKFIETIR